MRIKNGKILIGKSFVDADIQFDRTITAIGRLEGPADMEGGYVIPGLVDVHTHGAVGEDFSDGKPAGLQPLADYYAAHGVTSYLATTMTLREEVLTPAMHAIRDFKPRSGAKCAGVHLEGPFLSYAKRGAQAAENLHKPDPALFHRLNEASGGQVRLVTVACEDAGASVELICDGLHIHPSVIRATYQLFGDKLNLISDSLRCAGMPDGDYELGGQPIVVKNHKATLLDGTLAGSSISLLDAVRNVVRFGLPLAGAVYAASTAPALAAGLDAGVIAQGKAADLLVLDEDLALKAVFVDGQRFESRP